MLKVKFIMAFRIITKGGVDVFSIRFYKRNNALPS